MRTGLLALVLFVVCTPAWAQSPIIAYVLNIYQQGSASASMVLVVPIEEWVCGQTKIIGPSENPTLWAFDDPANPLLMDCVHVDTRLPALPDGHYEGTAQATTSDRVSPEGNRAAFTRVSAPQAGCTDGTNIYPIGYQNYRREARKQTVTSVTLQMQMWGWVRTSTVSLGGNRFALYFRCDG